MPVLSGYRRPKQGDSACACHLLPDGACCAGVRALNARGNSTLVSGRVFRGTDADVTMPVLPFTQTVNVAGQQAALFAVLPLGELSVYFNIRTATGTGTSSGIGDLVPGSA